MLPVVIAVTLSGGVLFNLLVVIATLIMGYEWNNMVSNLRENEKKYRIFGIFYLSIPAVSLIYLRDLDNGLDAILYLFFIVWATDIAAYFAGQFFGGPKLAEKISPNKTVSGALAGLLAAMLIGVISFFVTSNISFLSFLSASVFLSAISQLGDLFESYVKRKAGVKDSGTLIPGHGGVLDRVDALLFAAPALFIIFWGKHNLIFA